LKKLVFAKLFITFILYFVILTNVLVIHITAAYF